MKWYSAVLFIALVAAVTAQQYYTGKWNNINTHDIINNERLFKKYKQCILDSSPVGCPQEALELKKVLPEALKEVCAKCSPEQEVKIKQTLEDVCQKWPQDFTELISYFDPNNEYRPKFEAKFGQLKGGC